MTAGTTWISPADLAAMLAVDPPTPEQAAVIAAPLEPVGVVAGAGSGKTATMAARVVWLVATGAVRPAGVLGLTFTRKAAAELSTRVRRQLATLQRAGALDRDEPVGEPTVSTYHAYAGRLVADHALREAREPGSRLITPAVQWQLVTGLVAAYDGPMDAVPNGPPWVVDTVLALAGELAEHLRTPIELAAELDRWCREAESKASACATQLLKTAATVRQLLPLVEAYAAEKAARDLLDYGDQVALAARIAMRHPEVGVIERARHPVVLLDEYQDTGQAQRELLRGLYGGGHPVTAVGDPCQSIYGWRGGSAGGLRRFAAHFPRTDGGRIGVRQLATSFRNGERVLTVANRLAGPLRVDDPDLPMLTTSPAGRRRGAVVCALLDTAVDEAAWVADQIFAALQRGEGLAPDSGAWSDGASRRLRPAEVAVLCRKRSQFAAIRRALDQRGVPTQVVGLGGLLTVPEVLDLVSVLRVLDDPTANAALVRLLTGPRLRLGPRDLVALGRRARHLLRRADRDLTDRVEPTGGAPAVDPLLEAVAATDDTEVGSLVEALDDLGPVLAYSPVGYERLTGFAAELRGLRRRVDATLPELAAEVERTLRLDVEVPARSGTRADLDAFIDAAAEFASDDEEPTLRSFLAYLEAAEAEEFGLEPGQVGADDTVKVMTVHAAKGLEWPVVAVPGLAAGKQAQVFPAKPVTSNRWIANPALLPFALRGDAADLPVLSGLTKAAGDAFDAQCRTRHQQEERRLGYVAVTRAAHLLLCSGYWWGDGSTRLGPSDLLTEIREAVEGGAGAVAEWAPEPPEGAANPLHAQPATAMWPQPPSGPAYEAALAGARLVEAVRAGTTPTTAEPERAADWAKETRLLLAERAAVMTSVAAEVALAEQLSASTLVRLRRSPDELARSIRRPLPERPSPQARRGTAFHAWLESHYGQLRLLDLDELPGAADEGAAPDDALAELQRTFQQSEWWPRTPVEIEVAFETRLDGLSVRGRIDAVFRDPDGGWTVVDWKTGPRPHGPAARAAEVQLAAYRLAWARLAGVPLAEVRAAFHYVAAGETVRPIDLLDEAGLRGLVASLPPATR